MTFLEVDSSEWNANEGFKNTKMFIEKMIVVNDNAERGVALIKSFNTHLTKNEEQLQYILQIVEKHREIFPNITKSIMKN